MVPLLGSVALELFGQKRLQAAHKANTGIDSVIESRWLAMSRAEATAEARGEVEEGGAKAKPFPARQ